MSERTSTPLPLAGLAEKSEARSQPQPNVARQGKTEKKAAGQKGVPKTHGHMINGKASPEYESWRSMVARCERLNNNSYSAYGGRGIKVCEQWRESFQNFLSDMGNRPKGHSIDRIDNNGNYEPGNCRWSTAKEQQRNTRGNRRLSFDGVTLTATEWAERLGMKPKAIHLRLFRGWSVEKTLTQPLRPQNLSQPKIRHETHKQLLRQLNHQDGRRHNLYPDWLLDSG